ncbi:SRPBCC family protein [Photobacterium sp. OFAV2-7]|uniref:SRPBCC family protein n=1 Tax=Photobacterium sp. OFAV2-7 TaxID=2917748 RepID=UPI001EF63E3E|nr:SRPBCC family protein [Photobacterium sp. OFAV2-7]MCG7586796.1 SRPBCC family protein [Photobacterium sp. OFAV2-7]
MQNSKTARLFLSINAVFSMLIGLVFILSPNIAADMLFIQGANWQVLTLRILGAGLLFFAIDLMLLAKNQLVSKKQVLLITFMNLGWIIASVMLLSVDGHLFTEFGKATIVVIASLVVVIAWGQYAGAKKITPLKSIASVYNSGGKLIAKVTRAVDAPSDVVWSVMTDHPSYADVASNISKVEVVSGYGLGMQRRCYGPKGENWLETCDFYEENHSYGFNIHTEAENYPYPLSQLHGEWSVIPKGQGAEFSIYIEATPKGNFIVKALFKLAAKKQFKGVLIGLADAWAVRMENTL